MLTLRPYQQDLVNSARRSIQSGHRAPLLVSPCGSGKTVCFSYLSQRVMMKKKRVLILAHRDELLDQISDTLHQFTVPHSFIAAGRAYNKGMAVQIGSVFSAVRRISDLNPPDLIIIDEAHHAIGGSTWGRILTAFPKANRLGVTATPMRLSGEPLSDLFDDLIVGPGVGYLISIGALCKYRIFAPSTIDTAGVHKRGGDFMRNELTVVADKPKITGDAIREYKKLADGKRAIAYCVSIEHAQHVAEMFRSNGYRAAKIDGRLDRATRREMVADFRVGKIQVLTSCDVISEGFDLPAIEVAIMLRPTHSLALWIQQSGRALRPLPGKEYAIIIDHAGNCQRHGFIDDEHVWSLEGGRKKKGDEENDIKIRTCPKCFAVMRPGPMVCPHCKFVFTAMEREIEHVDGDLVEIDPEKARRERFRQQGRAESEEDLIALGKARNYRNPFKWAKVIFQARQARKLRGA